MSKNRILQFYNDVGLVHFCHFFLQNHKYWIENNSILQVTEISSIQIVLTMGFIGITAFLLQNCGIG